MLYFFLNWNSFKKSAKDLFVYVAFLFYSILLIMPALIISFCFFCFILYFCCSLLYLKLLLFFVIISSFYVILFCFTALCNSVSEK